MFGDRRGMYRAALRRFDEVELAAAEVQLTDAPGPPQGALARLIEGVIAAAEVEGAPRGCFLSNACAEADPADHETQGLLSDMTDRLAAISPPMPSPRSDRRAGWPARRKRL